MDTKQKKDNFYLQIFDFNELKRIKNKLNFKGKSILLIGENSWNEAPNNDYTYLQTEDGLKKLSTPTELDLGFLK